MCASIRTEKEAISPKLNMICLFVTYLNKSSTQIKWRSMKFTKLSSTFQLIESVSSSPTWRKTLKWKEIYREVPLHLWITYTFKSLNLPSTISTLGTFTLTKYSKRKLKMKMRTKRRSMSSLMKNNRKNGRKERRCGRRSKIPLRHITSGNGPLKLHHLPMRLL